MRRALALAFAMLIVCVPSVAGQGNGPWGGDGPGGDDGDACGGLAEIVAALPYGDVSAAEEADLVFMREEEKLVRDVYQAMDDVWGLRIFSNIMWAEQTHMNDLLLVLDKYGIPDPVGDNPPGVFVDAELQQLFDDLLATGSQSLIDALIVGATIEDVDIVDLQDALARTDDEDIRIVYQNLQKGSRNHLRSFVGLLEANDVTYVPQYLTQSEFDAIVTSAHEQGMVDADGEPLTCGGTGGGANGPGPGGTGHHRRRLENRSGSQAAAPFGPN